MNPPVLYGNRLCYEKLFESSRRLPGHDRRVFRTGEAQDFGGMSFGEAGNFGPPQTSGSSKATVTSYGEAYFVIVTELVLPDHWHVYIKFREPWAFPWKPLSSLCPASGWKAPSGKSRNCRKGL